MRVAAQVVAELGDWGLGSQVGVAHCVYLGRVVCVGQVLICLSRSIQDTVLFTT